MYRLLEDDDQRIGQTVIDDQDLALQVAAEMVAGAEDLAAVTERPHVGPQTVHQVDVERGHPQLPDGWDEEDEDEWQEALQNAFDEAGIVRSKGTLTTKTMDGRDYYYLQWRDGEKVKSQYVAPVDPS